jgi:hypothetical protein
MHRYQLRLAFFWRAAAGRRFVSEPGAVAMGSSDPSKCALIRSLSLEENKSAVSRRTPKLNAFEQ